MLDPRLRSFAGAALMLGGLPGQTLDRVAPPAPTGSVGWRCTQPPRFAAGDAQGACDRSGRLVVPGMRTDGAPRKPETWSWDGSRWSVTIGPTAPQGYRGHACTFAPYLGAVVWFNGSELLRWTGQDWTPLPAATKPTARSDAALACDEQRQRLVLFGGRAWGDTWEWDGSTWTQRQPASSPPADAHAVSTYDLRRGVVVLRSSMDAATWEWNGVDWARRVLPQQPPARQSPALVYDVIRGVTVMFGGFDGSVGVLADLWEYDGMQWSLRSTGGGPAPRTPAFWGYDLLRRHCLIGGGSIASGAAVADLWAWDGRGWRVLTAADGPGAISEAVAGCDESADEIVLYGGFDEAGNRNPFTWVLGVNGWRRITTPTDPGPRICMAFDRGRGRLHLLTGASYGPATSWEWNGSDWLRLPIAGQPIGAYGASLTYDDHRRVLVCYSFSGTPVNELWECDGVRWTRRSPTHRPPSSGFHGAAYDPVRRETIVCTGGAAGGVSDLMWSWNGDRWQQLTPPSRPSPRSDATMFVDRRRQHVMLYGGVDPAGAALQDLWEWDGWTWRRVSSSQTRTPRAVGRADAYDQKRSRLWSVGGYSAGFHASSEVWAMDLHSGSTGPGTGDESMQLIAPAPALLGGESWLQFPSPRRSAVLGLAFAPPATAIPLRPPWFCSAGWLRVDAATASWLPVASDPGLLRLPIPTASALIDLPLFSQALVQTSPNCLQATNGLVSLIRAR